MTQDYAFLDRILNCLHDQVAVIGRDLKIHYHNQAFESFLLLNLKDYPEIHKIPIKELFPPEMSGIIQAIEDCFSEGQIVQRTIELHYLNRRSFYKVVIIPHHRGSEIAECILILYCNTEVELKKIELSQQIDFLSKLIRRLPLGVYMFDIIDEETAITLWNPKMADYFSIREEETIGREISTIFDEETVKRHLRAIEQIDTTGLYYQYPAEYVQTPQGMRYFQTILAPMLDQDHSASGFSYLGIMEDVSEKIARDLELKKYQRDLKEALKRASEKLTVSNAEISSILENSYGVSIFSVDRDMRYRVFNFHHQYLMSSLFGKKIDKQEKVPLEFSHLTDKGVPFLALLEDALQGKSIAREIHYILPDETDIFMDAVVSPLYSSEEIIGVTVILFDTTEQRRTEKEAEIFKSVAENADYGVLLTNTDFDIRYVNPYWERLFNTSGSQLTGQNLNSILLGGQIARIKQTIAQSEDRQAKDQLELDMTVKEGETITVLMNFVPYKAISGAPGGVAFTCLDISPMKQAREALIIARDNAERSSILKSTFVANMSHEIRTPLNAILGFADLMDGQLSDPQLTGYLRNILSSGEILKGLINDVLDFSKIEAGKMSFTPVEEDIVEFMHSLFHLFHLQAKEKKLRFEILSANVIPEILIYDPLRLRQILINLIGNALKFTPWGYVRLVLKYEYSKEALILSVEDTGIGIPKEEQKNIFNPFEQQEKQDSRSFEGTGLGLAITKKLIDLMSGTLLMKSDRWEGSRFIVSLPLKRGQSASSQKIRLRENNPSPENQLTCFVAPSLLSEPFRQYGKKHGIRFLSLDKDALTGVKKNDRTVILTDGEGQSGTGAGEVLIRLTDPSQIPETGQREREYALSSRLKSGKLLPMVHSILQQEISKGFTGELDFKVLDDQEREIVKKAIETKNFQDINEALPLIKRCESLKHPYSEALESAVSTFNIPALNKVMGEVRDHYSHKDG